MSLGNIGEWGFALVMLSDDDLETYLTWNFPRKVAVRGELKLTRFFGSVVHNVDVPRLRIRLRWRLNGRY